MGNLIHEVQAFDSNVLNSSNSVLEEQASFLMLPVPRDFCGEWPTGKDMFITTILPRQMFKEALQILL